MTVFTAILAKASGQDARLRLLPMPSFISGLEASHRRWFTILIVPA